MRLPEDSQKLLLSAHEMRPLQPPRPRSLSPHTSVAPLLAQAALFHPRSVQLETEVPCSLGVGAGSLGAGNGERVGSGLGAGVGGKTGAAVGSGMGRSEGLGVGAGTGIPKDGAGVGAGAG